VTGLLDPLDFIRGPGMKNRFMLAPLTNCQSHEDGTLSEEEFRWLTMRAEGGFGLTMTCATHVQARGQGFPGQLGVFDDRHIEGHARLASAIRSFGSLAVCQLHHAGLRAPADLIGEAPVAPSDHEKSGARGLNADEVGRLVDDFVAAAVRCERAGYDGVELHGAHSYIICQFLSDEYNRRSDEYGGSLENRSRLLREIVAGVRARCRADFMLGVRLSGERFGTRLQDMVQVAAELMASGQIDFLDMSLWDVFKEPEEPEMQGKRLVDYFTGLERHGVRLGIAGKIRTPEEAERALETGVDWIMLGRAAILNHDFPLRYAADPRFQPTPLPVTPEYLGGEGVSPKFVEYLRRWEGFVA
jgi:2,4-dienoyl-CoA reductase-like NADH-dependent reductase (Old Yellow Enzyme family)